MDKGQRVIACLLTGFALTVTTAATADTIHVPGDYPTIQEAINAAVDGDQVVVAPGTYLNERLLTAEPKDIVVRSSDGPEVTTIQEDGTVIIETLRLLHSGYRWEGLTFRANESTNRAAVKVAGAQGVVFSNCVFRNSEFGVNIDNGAIATDVRFENCKFAANQSHGAYHNTLVNTHSTFVGCTATGNGQAGFSRVSVVLDCVSKWNRTGFDMAGGDLFGCTACGNQTNITGYFYDGGGNRFMSKCPVEKTCDSDITGDGDVSLQDLLVILSNWGPCPQ